PREFPLVSCRGSRLRWFELLPDRCAILLPPKRTAPGWGNRAPANQKRLGEIRRPGGNGPVSKRTVVLFASEVTIAGRVPGQGRFGNYSDPACPISRHPTYRGPVFPK